MGELNHPTTDHEPRTYQRHSALKKKWQHHSEHHSLEHSLFIGTRPEQEAGCPARYHRSPDAGQLGCGSAGPNKDNQRLESIIRRGTK